MEIKELLQQAEERMNKSIEALKHEFASIRTGRASVALLDKVMVDYYGSPTPINQVANISVPEPRMIVIAPWDKTMIGAIEKAILQSDLGLNPGNDGAQIRLTIPQLTEERRKEIVKVVHKKAEDAKVAVRNIRRDVNDALKKEEKAKTKEIAFTFYRERSYFTTNLFQTDYKNFIDLAYLGERPIDQSKSSYYPFYQSLNRDKAKVNGIEISTHLEIGDLIEKLEGFHLGYKLTYQKGRIKDSKPLEGYKKLLEHNPKYMNMALQDQPMNALQPTTSVYNLGYDSPNKIWGLDFYITDVSAKKAKDSFNPQWHSMIERQAENINTGAIETVPAKTVNGNEKVIDRRALWRNKHYTVIDAIAYWKPIKNLTFTAGVYNLTNQKYLTWESARSIRTIGTINRIDTETGIGLNRFYAPGRNYRASIQLEF